MANSSQGDFGKRLRALRLERGLSQQGLGGDRYTAAYISHLEAGKRRPSAKVVGFLADSLGIGQEELLTGRPANLEAHLELRLHEARLAIDRGDLEDAEASVATVTQEAAQHRMHRVEAKAAETGALVAERAGREQDALEKFEAAERLWDKEPAHLRYRSVAGTARCIQALGDTRLAIHILESYLLELGRQELKDPVALMRTYSGLVGAYFTEGLMDKAVEAAAAARNYEMRAQVPEEVACMNMNVARVLLYQGAGRDAMDALRRAEEIFAGLGWNSELIKARIAQGIVAAEKSDYKVARLSLRSALQSLEAFPAANDQVRALQELARVERLSGNLDKARQLLGRAMPLLDHTDLLTRGMTYRELGLAHVESDPDEARRQLETAVDIYRQARAPNEAAGTLKLLGRLHRARGDIDASLRTYEEALDCIEERA